MSDQTFTANYLRANAALNKNIAVVVTIDGVPFKLSSRPVFTKVRYGDPGLVYGLPGLVYGGLRRLDTVKDYLSLDGSSLTIAQRLEPEQGRGSVSQLTLAFIDVDNTLTQIVSPGIIINEILGKNVTVELGYEQLSYPQDYFVVFRAFISAFNQKTGLYTLQLSDPNLRRRQQLFFTAQTTLTAPINSSVTTIPVVNTGDFYKQILGPNGGYDPAIKTYFKIDDEIIQYPTNGIASATSFQFVSRGTRGTTAAAHASGATVTAAIEISDHCIDMSLKLMLSGWNGPWTTNQPLKALQITLSGILGTIPNAIIFPDGVDVLKDYGVVIGDQVTISGATDALNDITANIIDFLDISDAQPNQIILLDQNLNSPEFPTPATVSFRSQYDTYPVLCGLRMSEDDVDIQGHLDLKREFLADSENSYRFYLTNSQTGKDFLESEVYLPTACYSVTRRGRCSVKLTKPPLASSDLIVLTQDNIVSPENITIARATNTRHFFNEIQFQFDADDDGNFQSILDILDSDSLTDIQISSVLPITSLGAKTSFTPSIEGLFERRGRFLLSRYKRGAVEINVQVNWGTANLIEAGDIVALNGDGLQLPNFQTGDRNFGTQLFEVVNRALDIKTGRGMLGLINGVGATATDRFGTISPSSELASGSTTSTIIIRDSYSAANPEFPGAEPKKWSNYMGQKIVVHSKDYSFSQEVTFTSFDPANRYKMNVSPALSSPPPAGYVIDIPMYPTTTNPSDDSLYKAVHCHLSPQVAVVSGVDASNFTVGGGDIAKFFIGAAIRVHNYSYSQDSDTANTVITVKNIVGNQITTSIPLGFTPSSSDFVDLIGFADHGGAYRWV